MSNEELARRALDFYDIPGNEAGGSLHLLLDDDNTGNESIQFCIDFCKENGDKEGLFIAEQFLAITETEREKVLTILMGMGG
jgi:hypothetical protein